MSVLSVITPALAKSMLLVVILDGFLVSRLLLELDHSKALVL